MHPLILLFVRVLDYSNRWSVSWVYHDLAAVARELQDSGWSAPLISTSLARLVQSSPSLGADVERVQSDRTRTLNAYTIRVPSGRTRTHSTLYALSRTERVQCTRSVRLNVF